jgi:hypothetical protein
VVWGGWPFHTAVWTNLRHRAPTVDTLISMGQIARLVVAAQSGKALPPRRAIAVALAADTLSIATMEIVDNDIVLALPGAMDAGLGDALFWGSLAASLAVALAATVPVNRALIARGKGHAVVHEYHH